MRANAVVSCPAVKIVNPWSRISVELIPFATPSSRARISRSNKSSRGGVKSLQDPNAEIAGACQGSAVTSLIASASERAGHDCLPSHTVLRTLRIEIERLYARIGEAHCIVEMGTSENLCLTVHDLAIEPFRPVSALY
jgi:hypothetical protein